MDGKTDQFEYDKTPEGIRLTRYIGRETDVRLPEEIDGQPVTILGSQAFYENGMEIERITVPGSVKKIEASACEFCLSLQEMVLEEGVEELGREFMVISEQMELKVPASVRKIDYPAELGIHLVISPDSPWYETDGYGLFRKTEDGQKILEMVEPEDEREFYVVPEGVTAIADGAFENQEYISAIHLPESLKKIEEGALANMRRNFSDDKGIRTITVEAGNPFFFSTDSGFYRRLPEGGLELLRYTGRLSDVKLREDIREIGTAAFLHTDVEKITFTVMPDKIYPDAFMDCKIREICFEKTGFTMYLPATSTYLQKKTVAGFGKNGKLYDFSVYDAVAMDEPVNYEKILMILCRLKNPVDLSEEQEQYFRNLLTEKMNTVLNYLLDKQDIDGVRFLAELGFFTADNIDGLIERFNRSEDKQVLAILMDYKNTFLGNQEFDFSL